MRTTPVRRAGLVAVGMLSGSALFVLQLGQGVAHVTPIACQAEAAREAHKRVSGWALDEILSHGHEVMDRERAHRGRVE
jgi:hypothetical protein